MKAKYFTFSLVLCLNAAPLALKAQEKPQVQQLQQQLRDMQEQFERTQQQQRLQMETLKRQIDALQGASPSPVPTQASPAALPPPTPPPSPAPIAGVETKPWSPADPLRVAGNQSHYINLSLDGLFAAGSTTASDVEVLQPGGHDPYQRGFSIQNVEMVLEGVVDPYFRAQGNLIFKLDAAGETVTELEEAWAQTTSLPGNFQIKGGQYLSEFGRLNPTHPHAWAFVDSPLVNARFLGPDGLRTPGIQVSWLAPTPFYSELFLGVQNSSGETAGSFNRDPGIEGFTPDTRIQNTGDLLFVPRYAASFDLTPEQTIVWGASAALGPNSSGADNDAQLYGTDLFYKWKPSNASGGFPFVSWQTEVMARRFKGGFNYSDPALLAVDPSNAHHTDYGAYSQVSYGFKKGWVTALRGDYVTGSTGLYGPDEFGGNRWRISPNLTWYPTEFSKIRLQYNYDQRELGGTDHSVWLQFEFLLGAHGAHKF